MMNISPHILATIGNTPLIQLRKVVSPDSARVVVKLEGANPTGSMKDRMALAMIETAEADGRLRPGGRVVEFTGGSTGTSLAMVCIAKGYRLSIVTSDAFSPEKLNHMRALGATLTIVPSESGHITHQLFQALVAATEQIIRETDAYWTDQFNNLDEIAGYRGLGQEIWDQTGGRVDAFVQGVGTGGSIRGVSTTLRLLYPRLQVVAVEPAESPVLSGGQPGAHRIEGIGMGLIPPLWDPTLVDEIETVSTTDAEEMARRLAREEAILAGTSSGANVVAALRVAERLGPNATVATLMIDNGCKYLSTELFMHG